MKLLLINKYDNRILTCLDSEKGSANCLEKFTEVSEEVFEEYQASSGKVYFIEGKIVSDLKKKSIKKLVKDPTEDPTEDSTKED